MTAIHQGQVDQWKSQKTGQRRAVSSVVHCFDGLWLRDCSTARGRALPCFSESTGHPASKPHGPAAAESTAQLRPLHTESQADRSLRPRAPTGSFPFRPGSNDVETQAGPNLFSLCFPACCRSCYLFFFTLHTVLLSPYHSTIWDSSWHPFGSWSSWVAGFVFF